MKRILAILLAVLMTVTVLPVGITAESENAPLEDAAPEAAPVEAGLPASYTLVGTSACPPIDDQGAIGSCVSQAATYMQFTNGVARYMQSLGYSNWKPNNGTKYGDDNYIFSPKFTYNFAGAATIPVAEILVTMGCATQNLSKFFKNGASSNYRYNGVWKTATTSWDVGEGVMETALRYRLNGYDHYWTGDVAEGQITTTTTGRALINEIKQAVVNGNVVLTGGSSGQWSYSKMTRAGSLAKAGEQIIYGALSSGGGGHQVSIVGYDDNCEFDIGGVTLKGAFLVANSWGQSWANSGYVWFMYDGINRVSEYDAQCASLRSDNRVVSLDQFLLTDWQQNIVYGNPALAVTAEVTTTDREKTVVELVRYDPATGESESYLPKLFEYSGLHDNYGYSNGYYTYGGMINGDPSKAYFTFSYDPLLKSIPSGKSMADYVFGVKVRSESGYEATLGKVTLKDRALNVLHSHSANLSENGGEVLYLCADGCYVVMDTPHCTMKPCEGYANPVESGGDFRFTLEPERGFTLKHATVRVNGRALRAVNGVYTLTDVTELQNITVEGITEDVCEKPISVGVYNWEFYDNTPMLNLTVSVTDMARDVYARNIGAPGYPYSFRLTDRDTGVSYYTVPHSIYDFGGNILYRLPLSKAGMAAVNGQRYDLDVEVCYNGYPLCRGSISSVSSIDYTPNVTVGTVVYQVGGSTIWTDAYPKGAKTYLRPLEVNGEPIAEWSGVLPETMDRLLVTLVGVSGDGSHTVSVLNNVCTVVPCAGSENPVKDGSSISFRLQAPEGYTADLCTVWCGDEQLTAVNGIYTIEDVRTNLRLTVSGIVEDANGKKLNISMYNNAGWEYYGNQYVMVVSVPNDCLDPAVYAAGETISAYPYSFRLTDTESGISYYMKPSSFYHFSSSTLYRLNLEPSGMTAVAGKNYSFTVELVYGGRALYRGSMTTTCGYTETYTPATAPHYITYTVNGGRFAKDAFLPGETVLVREIPQLAHQIGSWGGDTLPATMGSRDLSATATYTPESYLVKWVVDGVTTTETYAYGSTPVYPGTTPAKAQSGAVGYRFTGWDHAIVAVEGPTTYVAVFEETAAVYTVTWVVGKGTFTEEYEYGTVPSFQGDLTKDSSETESYRFIGWDKTLRPVTKNVTYTAQYEATPLGGKKGDINGDGNISIQDVTALLSALAAAESGSIYDINEDHTVSIQDVTALLSMLAMGA